VVVVNEAKPSILFTKMWRLTNMDWN